MGNNNVYRYDINIFKIIFLYFIYLFSNRIGQLLENISTRFLQCLKTFRSPVVFNFKRQTTCL